MSNTCKCICHLPPALWHPDCPCGSGQQEDKPTTDSAFDHPKSCGCNAEPTDSKPEKPQTEKQVELNEAVKAAELFHKWFGGQSAYFIDLVGKEALSEIVTTIERRRSNG